MGEPNPAPPSAAPEAASELSHRERDSLDLEHLWSKTELKNNIDRFRTFLKWLIVPFYAFGPFDLAVGLYYGETTTAVLGAWILLLIPTLLYARHILASGKLNESVALTVGCLLGSALVIVFLRPFLFPVLAIGCILGVAVALPFVTRRTLRRLVGVGIANTAFIITAGVLMSPGRSAAVPAGLRSVTLGVALFAVVGLVFLMVWLFSSRLTESLANTKRSQSTLAMANEQLRNVDRTKTQFMNMTAHEFSTPLTPIRIQLHLLRNVDSGNLSETQRASLGMIERNFHRLSQLAADLLDMTRVEAGKLKVDKQPLRLGTVTADAVRAQQDVADANGIRLSARLDDTILVSADPRRLAQVLDNFLGNAIKFTSRGGEIHVELQRYGGEARLTVRDTGVGIRAADIKKLFAAFSQVESRGNGPRPTGTGLGLFISKGIIAAHGGRVWAESGGPGTGSLFGFALPLLAAPASAPMAEPPRARPEAR